ncbi:MAG: HepT-like ribonuclease domain-containing protein [Betaproteobacteria bacterium]
MLEAIEAIRSYTRQGRAAFDANPMLRDAVVARLIQIGQAVKDARAEGMDLPALRPEIPWREIAGMRDRLAHKYWTLDATRVWGVVAKDLAPLRRAVRALVAPARRRAGAGKRRNRRA